MKKLLVGLGFMSLEGNVSLTPDNQVHVSKCVFPVPAAIQSSPVYAIVSTVVMGQLGPLSQPGGAPAAAAAATSRVSQPIRPVLPSVTSASGTYTTAAPAGGANGGEQYNAMPKALRGSP
jgi:hypothetical protein